MRTEFAASREVSSAATMKEGRIDFGAVLQSCLLQTSLANSVYQQATTSKYYPSQTISQFGLIVIRIFERKNLVRFAEC
jgi:hypothetical protein